MPTPHEHWRSSLKALGADPGAGENFYQGLMRRYGSNKRHYHSLSHIEALFRHFEQYREELRQPELVALAIWYHDAVYSTLRKGSEARSASLAKKQLGELGIKQEAIEVIATMIRQTADHHGPLLSEDPDLAWFLDFDLSILGTEPKDYNRYAENIRKEYKLIPEPLYTAGRARVLHKMLEAEYLYYTPAFRRSHERNARENLLEELRRLKALDALGLNN